MLCSRENVPLATQHPWDRSLAGRGSYHHQLHWPIPHHYHNLFYSSLISQPYYTSGLLKSSHTNSNCRKNHTFCPCAAPAHPRVHNVRAMHGWTNATVMTVFFPEGWRRKYSDILALMLHATWWPGTSLAANSIWRGNKVWVITPQLSSGWRCSLIKTKATKKKKKARRRASKAAEDILNCTGWGNTHAFVSRN